MISLFNNNKMEGVKHIRCQSQIFFFINLFKTSDFFGRKKYLTFRTWRKRGIFIYNNATNLSPTLHRKIMLQSFRDSAFSRSLERDFLKGFQLNLFSL